MCCTIPFVTGSRNGTFHILASIDSPWVAKKRNVIAAICLSDRRRKILINSESALIDVANGLFSNNRIEFVSSMTKSGSRKPVSHRLHFHPACLREG